MIVDQLSTYATGGAGGGARRLHRALLRNGIDSRFWFARGSDTSGEVGIRRLDWICGNNKGKPLHHLIHRYKKKSAEIRLAMHLFGRPGGLEIFTLPWLPTKTLFDPGLMQGDVLHLHWVSKMIDYPSFFASIPNDMPVVWTLRDINPLTGGCHYTSGCEAFSSECKHCPQLGRRGERDLANRAFYAKLDAVRNKNIHIVANSDWTERQARKSRILANARSFQTIHNGLDVEQFAPQDQAKSRQHLGLPPDAAVIAFGADRIDNRRKGLRELLDALTLLGSDRHIVALCFGKGEVPKSRTLPEVKSVGHVSSTKELARIYSAADVFVISSLEEAFGQTGIEALACGTPVVGFDTGGIPDYVRPQQTGLLAKVGDSVDLARQIGWILDRPDERERMSTRARSVAVNDFHHDKLAGKYIELYQAILANHSAVGSCSAA
jgi:glycosyltransferase involved in cell wall biosynthesis